MEKHNNWTANHIPDQTGKTVIITGANTGIGFEMAKELYRAGAEVVIAARDASKSQLAVQEIEATTGGHGKLSTIYLDLADLYQVRKFTTDVVEIYQQIDLLINNAGVMVPPPSKTKEGYELQFGVNFLGHFALTALLYPHLLKSSAARVVTLTSGAAAYAKEIPFDNLRLEKTYDEWNAYAVSKLADLLFAYEFDRKIKTSGLNLMSVAAHPGVVRTDLQRHIPENKLEGMFAQFPVVMEPWQGALPALFAATDPSVRSGDLYSPDGERELTGYPAHSKISTAAINDHEMAQRLWAYAEDAIELNFSV